MKLLGFAYLVKPLQMTKSKAPHRVRNYSPKRLQQNSPSKIHERHHFGLKRVKILLYFKTENNKQKIS